MDCLISQVQELDQREKHSRQIIQQPVSYYEKLPNELRLLMWEMVAEDIDPRIVTVIDKGDAGVFVSAPPAILSVCRISRLVGLKIFGHVDRLQPTTFNIYCKSSDYKKLYFNKNGKDQLCINELSRYGTWPKAVDSNPVECYMCKIISSSDNIKQFFQDRTEWTYYKSSHPHKCSKHRTEVTSVTDCGRCLKKALRNKDIDQFSVKTYTETSKESLISEIRCLTTRPDHQKFCLFDKTEKVVRVFKRPSSSDNNTTCCQKSTIEHFDWTARRHFSQLERNPSSYDDWLVSLRSMFTGILDFDRLRFPNSGFMANATKPTDSRSTDFPVGWEVYHAANFRAARRGGLSGTYQHVCYY